MSSPPSTVVPSPMTELYPSEARIATIKIQSVVRMVLIRRLTVQAQNLSRQLHDSNLFNGYWVVLAAKENIRPSATTRLDNLPQGVRLNIYNMLSQEDKITISTLCKKIHRDCQLPQGLQPPIDPICIFSSNPKNMDDYRGIRLFQQLGNQQQHDARKKIKIENVHQFGTKGASIEDLEHLAQQAEMRRVTALDISLARPQKIHISRADFIRALPSMVPNLVVVNLTNIAANKNLLQMFATRCPSLEKIIWNNGRNNKEFYHSRAIRQNCFCVDGDSLRDCRKLKEIEFNNCRFTLPHNGELASWLNNPNKFLFHKCSKNLERVFIKNFLLVTNTFLTPFLPTDIRQAVLVKFVRNSPSLQYFSSDLTMANITMLQSELPDIIFDPIPNQYVRLFERIDNDDDNDDDL